MHYYCEECQKFLTEQETMVADNYRNDRSYILCQKHPKGSYLMLCDWYFIGLKQFPDLLISRFNIYDFREKLYTLCETCRARFYCWTGGFG